jgi:hypothetical protein
MNMSADQFMHEIHRAFARVIDMPEIDPKLLENLGEASVLIGRATPTIQALAHLESLLCAELNAKTEALYKDDITLAELEEGQKALIVEFTVQSAMADAARALWQALAASLFPEDAKRVFAANGTGFEIGPNWGIYEDVWDTANKDDAE